MFSKNKNGFRILNSYLNVAEMFFAKHEDILNDLSLFLVKPDFDNNVLEYLYEYPHLCGESWVEGFFTRNKWYENKLELIEHIRNRTRNLGSSDT